jgi:hypothetical protein
MRKMLIIIPVLLIITLMIAQENFIVLKKDGTIISEKTAVLDSVKLNADKSRLVLYRSNQTTEEIAVSDISSMYFNGSPDTVIIHYSASAATVVNPLEGSGVQVVINGPDVVVYASVTDNEVIYQLTGSSSTGSFKIYSLHRFEILFDGVQLTNDNGPAVNIQSKKRVLITLAKGTVNTLADAVTYASSNEDQKATLFSEGQLVFNGEGTLNVSSVAKHGICSDDYIRITSGIINVTSAGKDAIHCNDKLLIEGGKITVTPTGDGFDCETGYIQMTGGELVAGIAGADAKAIKAETFIDISGGKTTITLTGAQSKGLKAKKLISVSEGAMQFNTSGEVVLTASGAGFDPSYCTAIKCDSSVVVSGGTIAITQTGPGNKGISADQHINISGGIIHITNSGNGATYKNVSGITDSYNATCITADGNIYLSGGSITTSNSGAAGKGVSANGTLTIGAIAGDQPVMNISTTGGSFLVSDKDYALPKTVKSDGALTINNGVISISSANDGLKSESSITINGGTTTIANSTEGVESKFIYINGGILYVTASDDGINATMGTTVGGTNQNDGSCLYVNGGYVVVSTTKGDAIDSNGNIVFSGGVTIVHGPPSSPEEDIDANGTISVNGGVVIGSTTNSNMNKAFASTSTQYALYAKSTSATVAANGIFRIQDNTGKEIITFRPVRTAYGFHFTSPELKQGTTYSIYYGGTYTGGTGKDGIWSGGAYTGGTLKGSFTPGTNKSVTLTY